VHPTFQLTVSSSRLREHHTGAGMGALISQFSEKYPDWMMCTYSVVLIPKVSNTVVEVGFFILFPNLVFSQQQLCEAL
jgi:hypothetical protein